MNKRAYLMALSIFSSIHLSNITKVLPITGSKPSKTAKRIVFAGSCDPTITRRVANYHPPIWKFDYLQALTSNHGGETHMRRANTLKEEVRMMLEKVEEPMDKMELIDTIQRLGISYHFEVEINKILESIYSDNSVRKKKDLSATALEFRILRQHGFDVPQVVFNEFKDESGNFKAHLCHDIKGLLYLYEASYLSFPGKSILDEARNFTAKHLNQINLQQKGINENDDILKLVGHALELPLHWRMPRMEARWFIDVYERRLDMDSNLLELAKLDFNMVQAVHQEDLKHMSSWWKSTGLGEKLSFARDRLMENFFWTVGVNFKPEFKSCRRILTKINCLITTIDDVYDVYGTLQELELFTDAVERWEINGIEKLPNYMKICFLALYNSINEMAYESLKEQDFCSISYLKHAWANLCKIYLQEAKWYYSGYTPTLEEYMKTAWISVSGPLILVHAYFSVANPIRTDALECLEKYTHVIKWSSMILRLSNDLGTSQDELKRGDNPKSIECYMHETGASKEEAQNHVRYLIEEAWKNMNEVRVADSPFDEVFIDTAMNLARMAQYIYQHGDGHGIEHADTKDRVMFLLINPVPLI